MRAQFFGSIFVGLIVSAVLFLPLVVWQYRRYGRFVTLRMLWTTAGFIYATAIVAFTVFPLPEFTPGYCAAHATTPLLDPFRLPREVLEIARSKGVFALITDWVIWEASLNVVLFVPFGMLVRRIFELPRGVVIATALIASVLIEITQLTANWGLAPCPYRFADVTDLFTNTGGAVVGIALERITPRLLSTKSYLLQRREQARAVTRGRRLLGMVLDAWYLMLATAVGGTFGSAAYALGIGGTGEALTASQMLALERAIFLGAGIAGLAVVLAPALLGTGASLGQRTVYLCPQPRRQIQARLLLRAICVQGVGVALVPFGLPSILLAPVWAMAALLSAVISTRGLSGWISGCCMIDARTEAITAPCNGFEPAREDGSQTASR